MGRLSGMERDLAAIQAKLDSLEQEAEKISEDHPEEVDIIRERIAQIIPLSTDTNNIKINNAITKIRGKSPPGI